MDFLTSSPRPHEPQAGRHGEGEPAWEDADGSTWRDIALGLVEVDRCRLYEEEGWRCRNIEQYAQWEHCLTPAQTQELLRVGKKLLDLPEIDRAFCEGWLTWEHVVVLTRVAVPQHETAWLERALELPPEDLAFVVERSAEGWAPPVARDRREQAEEGSLGGLAEALDATSWGYARPGGPRRLVGPRLRGRIASGRVRPASTTGFWRVHGAPNVRHRPGAPPSTS